MLYERSFTRHQRFVLITMKSDHTSHHQMTGFTRVLTISELSIFFIQAMCRLSNTSWKYIILTVGHFTCWISLMLRLSLSPEFGLRSKISQIQGDHTPDNVKFPDDSRHSSATLGMLSVTHIMSVLVVTVSGGGRNATVHDPKTIYLTFKTQQTPTKYLYGHKYAVYNKQF